MAGKDFVGTRRASAAAPGLVMRLFFVVLVALLFLSLTGCSGYKWVAKQELEILAEGIEWYVERAQPKEDLQGEEKAKFERLGPKLSRNARALAE